MDNAHITHASLKTAQDSDHLVGDCDTHNMVEQFRLFDPVESSITAKVAKTFE